MQFVFHGTLEQVKETIRVHLFLRGDRTFEAEDSRFLRFMTMVSSGEITVPANSQELYKMLMNTQGLHSFPQIKDDVIIWELYSDVYVEAYFKEYHTIIDIIHKNTFRGSYTHWHIPLRCCQ